MRRLAPAPHPTRTGLARGVDVLRAAAELLGPNGERWDARSCVVVNAMSGYAADKPGPWCLFSAIELAYWRLDGSQKARAEAAGRPYWGHTGSSLGEAHRALVRHVDPSGSYFATELLGWGAVAAALRNAIDDELADEITFAPFGELGPLW